jgi:hypothetical protein
MHKNTGVKFNISFLCTQVYLPPKLSLHGIYKKEDLCEWISWTKYIKLLGGLGGGGENGEGRWSGVNKYNLVAST